jgi:hypothetical protein
LAGHVAIGWHATPPSAVTVPPPQTLGVPLPPQIEGAGHAPPQLTVPPHPSAMTPQFIPAGHDVSFVQLGVPHWFATPPPPQIAPPVHFDVPQSMTPPQPSATLPHSFEPHEATALGTHAPPSAPPSAPPPQTLGVPPPPHFAGSTHAPQSAVTPPQPSD